MVAPGHTPDDGRNIFRPPAIPTEVSCIHCGEVYDSYLIEWREGAGPVGDTGAWCCPTPGCDGLGFLFDIWPTDPEWRDEHGNKVCWIDDEDEDDDFSDENLDDPDNLWDLPDEQRNIKNFDPTWGDLDRDLPPDPFPPPRHDRPPDTGFNDEDIPF